jgi:hypothetical protein
MVKFIHTILEYMRTPQIGDIILFGTNPKQVCFGRIMHIKEGQDFYPRPGDEGIRWMLSLEYWRYGKLSFTIIPIKPYSQLIYYNPECKSETF